MVETRYSVATLPQQAAQAQHSTPRSTQPAWQANYPAPTLPQAVQAHYPAPTLPQQAVQAQYTAFPYQLQQLPTLTRLQGQPSFTPQPSKGAFEVHLLQFCPPAVRVCFGCSQTLKPANCILDAPLDIVIVSRMLRSFNHPNTGEKVNKEGNVYFHLNNKCISSKQPYFHPSIVTVPHWVQSQLTATHISYLRQCGVRI
jgi:hypothetical protein